MSSDPHGDYESNLAAIAEAVDLRLGSSNVGPYLLESLTEVDAVREGTTREEVKGAILATLWHAATEQVRRCDPEEYRAHRDRAMALAGGLQEEVDVAAGDLREVRRRIAWVRKEQDRWGDDPPVLLGVDNDIIDYASGSLRAFASVAGSLGAAIMKSEEEARAAVLLFPGDGIQLKKLSDFVDHLEGYADQIQAEVNGKRAQIDLLMARYRVMLDVWRVYEILGDVPPYGVFVTFDPLLHRAHIWQLGSDETYVLSEIADEIKDGAGTVREAYARVAAQLKAAAPDASLAVTKLSAAVSKLNKRHHTTVAKMKLDGRRSMVDSQGRRSSAPDLSGRRLTIHAVPGRRPAID